MSTLTKKSIVSKFRIANSDKEFIKEFIVLSIPLWLQYMLNNIMYILDNVMVSSLCSEAVSAVGIMFSLNGIPYKAVTGLLLGSRAFTLKALRTSDEVLYKKTTSLRFILVLIIAGVYIALMNSPLINLVLDQYTKSEDSLLDTDLIRTFAIQYGSVISIQFMFSSISRTLLSSLKELGKGKNLIPVTITSTVLGVFFNWVLIGGNLGFPELGVRGAAVASLISSLVEILFYIVVIKRENAKDRQNSINNAGNTNSNNGIMLEPKDILINMFKWDSSSIQYLFNIVKHCVPIVISYIARHYVVVYIQQCYSTYSVEHLTAMNITTTVVEFLFLIGNAVSEGANIILSKRSDTIESKRRNIKILRRFMFNVCLCIIPVVIALGVFAINYVYNVTTEIVYYGEVFIFMYSILYTIEICSNIDFHSLMNLQKTKEITIINCISYMILDFPLSLILSNLLHVNVYIMFVVLKGCSLIRLIYSRVQVNYYYSDTYNNSIKETDKEKSKD